MTTYTENCNSNANYVSTGIIDKLIAAATGWIANQRLKHKVRQERRQLLEMSEGMLKDIGVSRAEAEQEARRTDLPATRIRVLLRQ